MKNLSYIIILAIFSSNLYAESIKDACEEYAGYAIIEKPCITSANLTIKKGEEFAKKMCKEQYNSDRIKEVAKALASTKITSINLNLDASFLSDNDDLDLRALTRAQTNLVDLISRTEMGYSGCMRGVSIGIINK